MKENKIAIIGGGNLADLDILKEAKIKIMPTPYGKIEFYLIENFILINRHGLQLSIPPHRINHKANLFALKELGRKFIFSFNSVGSLKKEIKPGEILIPSDYINFRPQTFFDKKRKHITPEISQRLRKILIKILKKLNFKFHQKGVYFQTKGPRLETKAEINLIRNFADVVGMTMATEATLAKELDLEYASLCSIDNYAQGISKIPLVEEEIVANQRKSKEKIKKIIKEILSLKLK